MQKTKDDFDIPKSRGFPCPRNPGEFPLTTPQTPAAALSVVAAVLSILIVCLLVLIKHPPPPPLQLQAGDVQLYQMVSVASLDGNEHQQLDLPQPGPKPQETSEPPNDVPIVINTGNANPVKPSGNPDLTETDTRDIERKVREGTGVQDAGIRKADKKIQEIKMSGKGFSGNVFDIPPDSKIKSIVYVLDCSESMMGRPLNSVKAELNGALNHMEGKGKQFFIYFYNHDLFPLGSTGTGDRSHDRLLDATGKNVQNAKNWIATIQSAGGTNPVPAMLAAIKLKPDLIVLLSDGFFNDQMALTIINNNRSERPGMRINCVGITQSIQTLQHIANATGGKCYQAR